MVIYSLSLRETWNQYLDEVVKQMKEDGMVIRHAIPDDVYQIVASNEALKNEFGEEFDELNGTLNWNLCRFKDAIADAGISIEDLRANFNYGIVLAVERLQMQNRALDNILDQLDAIHGTFKNPTLAKAREFYRIGCKRLANGLLDRALESFHRSEEICKDDFFTQFQLGKLYLYGKDENTDIVDLMEAEKHFQLAIRCGKAEIGQLSWMDRWTGEALLHASIACYAQAGDHQVKGRVQEARKKMEEAAQLAQEATAIYPQLSEGYYHHAKFSALLGNIAQAIPSLKQAILADRNYCIKVQMDRDFDGMRTQVHNLFETLRKKAGQDAMDELQKVKKFLSDWVYLSEGAKEIQEKIEQWSKEAEIALNRNTYFDSLDALDILSKAQKAFKSIPYSPLHVINDPSSAICVCFSPCGHYLASGSSDRTVKIWEVSSGKLLKSLEGHPHHVHSVSFSPCGHYLASGGSDRTVKIWEVSSGKLLRSLGGHSNFVVSVSFSPCGHYLASGSWDGTIKIWEVPSGRLIKSLGEHSSIICVSFSPDGYYLASGSSDRTVKIWEVSSGRLIRSLEGHSNFVISVSFSPCGHYLASGSSDRTIKIWEVSLGKLLKSLEGHSRSIISVSFSPCGHYLASGGSDRTVKIWEVPSGRLFMSLEGYSRATCISFSPDGQYLASRGNNDIRIFSRDIISRRVYEEQERLEEKRRREQEELELQKERRKKGLCLYCGTRLSLSEKLFRHKYCKKHRSFTEKP